jgi:hypothetical protein
MRQPAVGALRPRGRRGHQPEAPPRGQRKGSNVWRDGRVRCLCAQGIEGGVSRHVPTRASKGSGRKPRHRCVGSTMALGSPPAPRPTRVWSSRAIA